MNWVPIGACDSHIYTCGSGMPPAYGLNNDCVLVVIAALGRDSTRGTAVIDGAPGPVENWGLPRPRRL